MWTIVCLGAIILRVAWAWRRSGLPWVTFFLLRMCFIYSRLWHRWSANRSAPFPAHGAAIIVSNHTCSPDPSFILAACNRPISFLVANEHFRVHPIIHAILKHMRCVPVVRTGHDALALRRALRRLQEGELVGVFPEGNLSGIDINCCRMPKPGAAFLALATRLPVYPVHISGGPHTDELVEGWIMPTRRAVRVVYGDPIDLSQYYGRPRTRRLIEAVSAVMMREIMALNEEKTKV